MRNEEARARILLELSSGLHSDLNDPNCWMFKDDNGKTLSRLDRFRMMVAAEDMAKELSSRGNAIIVRAQQIANAEAEEGEGP